MTTIWACIERIERSMLNCSPFHNRALHFEERSFSPSLYRFIDGSTMESKVGQTAQQSPEHPPSTKIERGRGPEEQKCTGSRCVKHELNALHVRVGPSQHEAIFALIKRVFPPVLYSTTGCQDPEAYCSLFSSLSLRMEGWHEIHIWNGTRLHDTSCLLFSVFSALSVCVYHCPQRPTQ